MGEEQYNSADIPFGLGLGQRDLESRIISSRSKGLSAGEDTKTTVRFYDPDEETKIDTRKEARKVPEKRQVNEIIVEPFAVMPFGLNERVKVPQTLDRDLFRMVWLQLVTDFRVQLMLGVESSGRYKRSRELHYQELFKKCFLHIDAYVSSIVNNHIASTAKVFRDQLVSIFKSFALPNKDERFTYKEQLDQHIAMLKPERLFKEDSIKKIGQGAFGVVYEAVFRRTGKKVALKIVLEKNRAALGRIREEMFYMLELEESQAAVSAYLAFRCPNDLPGIPGSKNHIVMVTEYIDGKTLREEIDENELKSESERLEWSLGILAGICDSLQNIHSKKIIHRDLKPANVKLDSKGRFKLLDFGLSTREGAFEIDEESINVYERKKELEVDDGSQTQLSVSSSGDPRIDCATKIKTHGQLGTMLYMSPEHRVPEEIVPESEAYVAGLIFMEAWTGNKVYQGFTVSTLTAFMDAVRRGEKSIETFIAVNFTDYLLKAPFAIKGLLRRLFSSNPKLRTTPMETSILARLVRILMSSEDQQTRYLLEYMQSRIEHGLLEDNNFELERVVLDHIPQLIDGMKEILLSRPEEILADISLKKLFQLSNVIDELIIASLIETQD